MLSDIHINYQHAWVHRTSLSLYSSIIHAARGTLDHVLTSAQLLLRHGDTAVGQLIEVEMQRSESAVHSKLRAPARLGVCL